MLEILEARIAPAALASIQQLANQEGARDLIAVDSGGAVYVAGIFFGTFRPGSEATSPTVTTADPLGDVYFAKYSRTGQVLWASSWGGAGRETLGAMVIDSVDGELFVTGSFDSTAAGFGGTGALTAPAGHPQLFVFKANGADGTADTGFDADGQLQFGSVAGTAEGTSITLASGGSVLIGGSFTGDGAVINGAGPAGVNANSRDAVVLSVDQLQGVTTTSFGVGGILRLSFFDFPPGQGGQISDDTVFRVRTDASDNVFVGLRSKISGPGVPPETPEVFTVFKRLGANGAPDANFAGGGPVGVSTDTSADFAIDSSGRVVAVGADQSSLLMLRYDAAGVQDTTFGNSGVAFAFVDAVSATIALDGNDRIYVAGATLTADYVARFSANGILDKTFVPKGVATFGKRVASTVEPYVGLALDPNGLLYLRDTYTGNPDLDPTAAVRKIAARITGFPSGMSDGFLLALDVNALLGGQTLTLSGGLASNERPQVLTVSLTGPGFFRVDYSSEGNLDTIFTIELFDTTLATQLKVDGSNLEGFHSIGRILTRDANQHVGSVRIDPHFVLGDGSDDGIPDLLISGKTNQLTLGDLRGNTFIKLGQDLPYDVATDKTTPDTYNHRPTLSVGNVLGANVIIENIGDGTDQGVGGGGFGNIVFQSWGFPGFLRTTQSIGDFTVKQGDFFAVLEIDKFKVGEETTANTGDMDIQDGAWGSSGTEVEGSIESFNADAFLAGATITAGSVGPITTTDGEFNGTLTLTDADANAVPVFSVFGDFTGKVVSASPLKKINVKGDFRGSLKAPSIAAITAFSFLGETAADLEGDADKLNITTTHGLLGLITAKTGIIRNYEFTAAAAGFSGLKVVLSKLDASTVGVENVKVHAKSIGPITVQLSALASAPGVDLVGIRNSEFTPPLADSADKVGPITVKLSGASGSSLGLSNVTFIGDIFGNATINVSKGNGPGATARAVDQAVFQASLALGKVLLMGAASNTQATGLTLWSGGKIGAVTVKATAPEFGGLTNGVILAGQSLDFTGATSDGELRAKLAGASLTGLTLSGSLRNSLVAAGASVGAVNVGGDLSESRVLAGTRLGADRALGGGDDAFQRAAKIAAVMVKGTYARGTISAGVNPVNGVFGDGDDVLGAAAATLDDSSEIGGIKLSGGVFLAGPPAMAHQFAIQAAKLAKVQITGQPLLNDFAAPQLLDLGNSGEDADDVLIRVLS